MAKLDYRMSIRDSVYFDRSGEDVLPLLATQAVYYEWPEDFALHRNNPTNCFLQFVVGGEGWYEGERGRVRLKAGVLFHFAPGVWHHLTVDPGSTLRLQSLAASGVEGPALFRKHLGCCCHAWQLGDPEPIAKLLEAAFQEARRGGTLAQSICTQYFRLLLLLLERDRKQADDAASPALATFIQVRNYLERNYVQPIQVQDAAAELGVSREHVSRLFQRFESMSPSRFLAQLRMSRACHLLQTSALPIHEVAEQVGMDDPYVFSKAFKRWQGQSPLHYRKAMRP
ncbi:MAG: helix-turn-helix domain-containing protein [Planctomycetota bacterium]|jgi:AraC-like DNA-binding protein